MRFLFVRELFRIRLFAASRILSCTDILENPSILILRISFLAVGARRRHTVREWSDALSPD